MKIALVHDHLLEFGGAERVLVALHQIYPEAHVYTSYYNPAAMGAHRGVIDKMNVRTSWADRVWGMKRLHSPLRFVYPWIWESLDLSDYQLVISSSATSMSRGVITKPDTLHISYIHHPPRYLYGYETAREWQRHWPVRVYAHVINHYLRAWDYESAQRPDYLIANSHETAARIAKFYRRQSHVIYPPVLIPAQDSRFPFPVSSQKQQTANSYYLTTSRLARAKHVDILIAAVNRLQLPLHIVGNGRDLEYLQSIAGPTVTFLTNLNDAERDRQYEGAKAFLFASRDEEFGIAPVEAMGHGVPVIAYASGGLRETVKHGENGLLYDELTEESCARAIMEFERMSETQQHKMGESARRHSLAYSQDQFSHNLRTFVEQKIGLKRQV